MINNKKFICAFSGGPDSVYLALFLKEKYSSENVVLAHFNHALRADESEEDEKFSKDFAEKNGFVFETQKWADPKKSEEKARNARYEFLETVREQHEAAWICTGHHQDDVAETVLLQFFRGGGLLALSGIEEKNDAKNIYRPLLNISKQEILEFLEEKKEKFRVDSSNLENDFTRNFLRNEILPNLEKKFPNLATRIAKKTKYFSGVQKILEEKAKNFLEKEDFLKGIEKKVFFAEQFPVRCEILKKLCKKHAWTQEKFEYIEEFLDSSGSGKKFEAKTFIVRVFGEKFFVEEKKN